MPKYIAQKRKYQLVNTGFSLFMSSPSVRLTHHFFKSWLYILQQSTNYIVGRSTMPQFSQNRKKADHKIATSVNFSDQWDLIPGAHKQQISTKRQRDYERCISWLSNYTTNADKNILILLYYYIIPTILISVLFLTAIPTSCTIFILVYDNSFYDLK